MNPENDHPQHPEKIRTMFASISSRYDLANRCLSLGMDRGWRRRTVRELASQSPRSVLDVATGSGDLARDIRRELPSALVAGADFCEPMLRMAQRKSLDNLVVADGMNLPFADSTFEAVTIAFGLRNMKHLDAALGEFHRVLADGGRLLVLDFSLPQLPPLRALYRAYLHHVLPGLAGWLTRQPDAYRYLGASIEAFPSGADMLERFHAAGFHPCSRFPLTFGIVTLYTGGRP